MIQTLATENRPCPNGGPHKEDALCRIYRKYYLATPAQQVEKLALAVGVDGNGISVAGSRYAKKELSKRYGIKCWSAMTAEEFTRAAELASAGDKAAQEAISAAARARIASKMEKLAATRKGA